MAYAAAVNEELRELEPVLDWIQLDEPYLEARPDQAKAYALPAIDRALAGLRKPTCVHVCFGYAFSHALAGTSKSGGYRFALELERSSATHLSLEAAQPRLDLAPLGGIRSKTVVLGVLDLGAPAPETPALVAGRLREALAHVPAERLVAAPDCGMKYLDRASARARLRALVEGARSV
jgi:5-methyltetrahydropteroyltriglutamate--homocysteine methyltransferase